MRQTGAAFLYSSFPAYCSSHARTVHYQEFQSQRAASMLAERVSDSLTHREKKKSVISRRRGLLVSACASGACSTNACACVCSLFTCYTCTNCVSMLIFVKRSKWESFVRSLYRAFAVSQRRQAAGLDHRTSLRCTRVAAGLGPDDGESADDARCAPPLGSPGQPCVVGSVVVEDPSHAAPRHSRARRIIGIASVERVGVTAHAGARTIEVLVACVLGSPRSQFM